MFQMQVRYVRDAEGLTLGFRVIGYQGVERGCMQVLLLQCVRWDWNFRRQQTREVELGKIQERKGPSANIKGPCDRLR